MVMRSNTTSPVGDVRELSEDRAAAGRRYGGPEMSEKNVSEQANPRPRVMSVPLEAAPQAGPRFAPQHEARPHAAPQPLMASSQPVPVESAGIGGRLPEGGGNATMKQRSVFEGARGSGSPVREVRLMNNAPVLNQLQVMQAAQAQAPGARQAAAPERAYAYAQPELGEERGAPEPEVQRQFPPDGMGRREAQQLADALSGAIDLARAALSGGEKWFGVDEASLGDASRARDYLANFAHNAGAADRTDSSKLSPRTLGAIERVLEFRMAQEKSGGSSALAIVVGVIVIGGIALLVAHNA